MVLECLAVGIKSCTHKNCYFFLELAMISFFQSCHGKKVKKNMNNFNLSLIFPQLHFPSKHMVANSFSELVKWYKSPRWKCIVLLIFQFNTLSPFCGHKSLFLYWCKVSLIKVWYSNIFDICIIRFIS